MLKVSPEGVVKIRQREGCVLRAYRDSVGVWTIGVGHTGRMSGPKVLPGMVITQARADALLVDDLAPVLAAIASAVKVTLTQNQVDALASLGFNIGVGGLVGSTVVHKLNAGDVAAAADAFLMWHTPSALMERRKAERAQFLTPDAGGPVEGKSPATRPVVPPGASVAGPPASGLVSPCTRPGCPLAAKAA